MLCNKCGHQFKIRQKIDGKWRNLRNRKYCLTCSPFNKHNTRNLSYPFRVCLICNKKMVRKNERGKKCWTCTNKINRNKKLLLVKSIVGTACWVCGYDKVWGALDLHHVYPETKEFQISTRELQFSWKKIEQELRKCALLCCRCHREYHLDLIEKSVIVALWKDRFKT